MKTMSRMMVVLAAAAFAATVSVPVANGQSTEPVAGSASSAASATARTGSGTAASSVNETGSAAAQSGRSSASAEQATDLSARLTKSIDSKHARVGDEVVARTTENARLADGTRLPKGSRLIGHVTEVHAKSRAEHDGQLAVAFDRAVLRNGRQVPIHAVMESISAPAPPSVSGDMMGQGGMGAGPAMAGGGGMVGGGAGRGGLVGGGGGGLVGGAAAPAGALRGTAGAAGNLAGNTASGIGADGSGAMNSTASLGRSTADLGGMGSGSSALSGRTFPVGNLSDVTFTNLNAASAAGHLTSSGSADGSASASRHGLSGSAGTQNATLITARDKNVELESGSQMTMSVTPQSPIH